MGVYPLRHQRLFQRKCDAMWNLPSHIKTMPQNNMSAAPLWDAVRGCIDQTRRAEEYLGLKQIQVLDEMDKAAYHTLGTFWLDTQCQAGPPLSYHEYETWSGCYPCSFFFDFAFCRTGSCID